MATDLIIDADLLVYQIGHSRQVNVDWDGDGNVSTATDFSGARESILALIRHLREATAADIYSIVLSAPTHTLFRRRLWPEYKAHRKPGLRPQLYDEIRRWLLFDLGAHYMMGLEGDDTATLLASGAAKHGYRPVIASIDKDFRGTPFPVIGLDGRPAWHHTEEEARLFHFMQTLTGDRVDGFPGCPGIGVKRAARLLAGARDDEERWTRIVRAFEKKGLTEADAILQARLAWLLRDDDVDWDRRQIRLWAPPGREPETMTL